MGLADWIRTSLWSQTDWREALARLCDGVATDSFTTAARLADLAQACELIEPDRRRALAMHQRAWELDRNPHALGRAFELAREIGDHDAIAQLALRAYQAAGDPALLATAALAYIDSGRPALAEQPLAALVAARDHDDEARTLLALIKRQLRDPQAEIASAVARGQRASGADSSRHFMHAARIARLAGLDAIYARHLEAAVQRGREPAATMLIEADLVARRRANDLLAFYRRRVESAASDIEWADIMRAAGTKLILHGVQRGLAMRLLRSGLEAAYRAGLVAIPGHLASWDLLIRHAREARSTRELMPLVVTAMTLPLDLDAKLFLARFGFEVTWREARESDAARPYAAVIAEHVPGDPELHDFVATSLPELVPIPPTAYEPPTEPLPPEPSFIKIRPAGAKPALPQAAVTALQSGGRKPGLPTIPPLPANAPRIAQRVVVPADVIVRVGSDSFSAIVRDLSTTGVYIVTERELAIDSTVTIELELPTADALAVSRHEVTAKIVRRADTGYGMLLVDPPPALVAEISALSTKSAT